MGRAIVRNPQAYLMDEPLSNLDAKLRVSMRAQLSSLHERLGVTTIYVTHDQIEAMTLGSRVAVLKDGELMQVDTPQMLFDAPDNLFVATFIGSPAMNLVRGQTRQRPGAGAGALTMIRFPVPSELGRAQRHALVPPTPAEPLIRSGCAPPAAQDATFAPAVCPRTHGPGRARQRLKGAMGSEARTRPSRWPLPRSI